MVVDYSEDRELLTLLRRGEISAFVDIYTTYYDALLNYADRLLNDVETQVFTEFDEQFQVLAWLALILLAADLMLLERKNPLFKNIKLFKQN